jgi:hypothetical protein
MGCAGTLVKRSAENALLRLDLSAKACSFHARKRPLLAVAAGHPTGLVERN